MPLRYCYAMGSTFAEMRERLSQSPLYKHGDALLVWVNEGDFWGLDPMPVDVTAEAEQRKREDAILAQADEIKARRAAS